MRDDLLGGGQVAWLDVHYLVSWDHHLANKE